MNQVALVGNITDDPELRYPEWRGPRELYVAVSHRSKHNGEWHDVNDGFFPCTAWRSVIETAAHNLKKGMRVFLAGKLVQHSWLDNDGGAYALPTGPRRRPSSLSSPAAHQTGDSRVAH